MTTPSLYEQIGLSVQVSHPLWIGSTALFSLTRELNGLTWTENAFGGFGQARIDCAMSLLDLYEWLNSGLGRDITVYDGDGQVCYAGYVEKVTANLGALSVSRGPLSKVANRVSAMYVPIIDDLVSPPVLGSRTETTIAEDVPSQRQYGIVEKVLNLGNCLDADANYVRDTYMAENKEPETTQTLNLSGGGELSLSIECEGYSNWLELMAYNDVTTPLSVELTTKIESILTAEQAVNGIFSTNVSHIDWNATLTSSYEGENRTALAIIKGIVAFGDASDNRWLFGVYEDRMVRYNAMPSTVEYQLRLHGRSQVLERADKATPVEPWSVRPGRWLFMPDLLPGFAKDPTVLRKDIRAMFIESVTFTAPYGISLNGAKVETLSQRLSQLGLGGL